jgi:hypothetical protein
MIVRWTANGRAGRRAVVFLHAGRMRLEGTPAAGIQYGRQSHHADPDPPPPRSPASPSQIKGGSIPPLMG